MSFSHSQAFVRQSVENMCVRCETRFPQWSQYHAHVTGPRCIVAIKPLNTSGRQTGVDLCALGKEGTIVGDWELKNKGAIIS